MEDNFGLRREGSRLPGGKPFCFYMKCHLFLISISRYSNDLEITKKTFFWLLKGSGEGNHFQLWETKLVHCGRDPGIGTQRKGHSWAELGMGWLWLRPADLLGKVGLQ